MGWREQAWDRLLRAGTIRTDGRQFQARDFDGESTAPARKLLHLVERLLGTRFRERDQGKTRVVAEAESINDLDAGILQTGDLAVTANGVHVLAYLGDGMWTEASPERMQVVAEKFPSQLTTGSGYR